MKYGTSKCLNIFTYFVVFVCFGDRLRYILYTAGKYILSRFQKRIIGTYLRKKILKFKPFTLLS